MHKYKSRDTVSNCNIKSLGSGKSPNFEWYGLRYFRLCFMSGFALFIVVLLYLPTSAFTQVIIDTTAFMNEEPVMVAEPLPLSPLEFPLEIEEDLPNEIDVFIPADMIFVPVDVMYSNRWDTLYVRTGFSEVHNMSDSVYLLLNNPEETPFCFPFRGRLLSKYGQRGSRFHAGMDVKLELNDTIKSAWDGKVRISRTLSGYGKMVLIRHNNGLETLYAHMTKQLVKVNQEVKAGDPIGLGGRTGRATTTHLHFETRFRGEHFNPATIIDFENFTLIKDTLLISREFWKKGGPHSPTTVAGQGDTKYHIIRNGDTLWKISRLYGISVDNICKLNGIRQDKVLKIGARLRVK